MQWSGRSRLQLLSQPPENRNVPRICNTPRNKGLRATNRRALVRLLIGETRASNGDHTLRHINPVIVRGGSGSEASMPHCDLTSLQSYRRQHRSVSCSAVAGHVELWNVPQSVFCSASVHQRQLQCQAGDGL
jgi:hypothetical protein